LVCREVSAEASLDARPGQPTRRKLSHSLIHQPPPGRLNLHLATRTRVDTVSRVRRESQSDEKLTRSLGRARSSTNRLKLDPLDPLGASTAWAPTAPAPLRHSAVLASWMYAHTNRHSSCTKRNATQAQAIALAASVPPRTLVGRRRRDRPRSLSLQSHEHGESALSLSKAPHWPSA